ncbi:MAG: carboxypeptidase-like regulatory domain-containing protein, partial [Candidatus Brocadiaceae bacterium]|nr:carboxypeptidase-like regulatory domain-containing protein [Candidatus Brocadiaceae bacterium]
MASDYTWSFTTTIATPTLPPLPSPIPSPSPSPTPTASGTGIIYGFVNDEDEFPLKNVSISLTGTNNYSESTETDEDGYYFFENLAAGDYALRASKSGYQSASVDISLDEGEAYEVKTLMLEVSVTGTIYGYVRDIKGDPIENVRLALKGLKTKYNAKTAADKDGFFEFNDLDADTYVIKAKKKRYRPAKTSVKLEEAETQEIEIEMNKVTKRGIILLSKKVK